ncbi:MAG: sugar phosphate isomerase/epimerase [Anaerolineae bacterium]|nr:sugar phosphate isomerase/epimerase [Anaerolineae bacterium]
MPSSPLAVQMYTVRAAAAQDFSGALQKVAQLGYDAVELAGTYNLSAPELRQILDNLGLKCVSAHVSLADLRADLDRQIDTYLALGAAYLACPFLPPQERNDYRAIAVELNGLGERCRAQGLQFCYHHHSFELEQFQGKYGLDILLEQSDPANVKLQVDTYWLQAGGIDPADYIRKWSGRVPLLHLKDMSATEPSTFAEIGTGILDWPGIFAAAKTNGVEWYIVEQDTCPGDPFESLKISIENYRHMTG